MTASGEVGPRALDAAILRVRGRAGHPVGVGFLVTGELALTCAHVVATALALAPDEAPGPDARLGLDLPLLPGGAHTATVERWAPERDAALLRLTRPPAGARPVRLVEASDVWDHEARAFGFPAHHGSGVWHAGRLRGRQADGLVQLDIDRGGGYQVAPGFSGGPVWDERLVGVVGMMAAAESGATAASFLIPTAELLRAWPDLRDLALPPSPFRSLRAFQEDDAGLFFGRDEEAGKLVRALRRSRWVTVVGASGSGKSSLALAGVVPRWRSADGLAVVLRPGGGSSPLSALAGALLPLLEPDLSPTGRLERLGPFTAFLAAPGGLAEVLGQLAQLHGRRRRLLVVVDQFEELFARGEGAVDELAGVLFGAELPYEVRVLTTLRADFLESFLQHRRLGQLFHADPGSGEEDHESLLLGPMSRGQLREVVTAPVAAVGSVAYQPHLVESILDDATAEAGALPLLGFTLEQLWQGQRGGVMSLEAYGELGGVGGALSAYAEQAWQENVRPADQDAARRLFTQLVRVPLGSAGATRRTVPRTDLGEEEWRIAQQLATTRLLVTGSLAEGTETVELAHDALITHWPRLADWVARDRAFLDWRESLRHDRDRWKAAGRPAELLPTDVTLAASQRWDEERKGYLTQEERDFLRRGLRHRRSRRRRRTAVAAVLCVLTLVAGAVSVVSWQLRDEAARRTAVVHSASLANDAAALVHSDPGVAAQLAVAAYRLSPTKEAASQLYATLQTPLDRVLADTGHAIRRVAAQKDGPLAAATDATGELRLWDLGDPGAPVLDAALQLDRASAIAFLPHRPLLAARCAEGRGLCLWDLADPRRPVTTAALPNPDRAPTGDMTTTALTTDAQGRLLAATDRAGYTTLWSVADQAHPQLITVLANPSKERDPLASVALAPDGRRLAQTASGGSTTVWDISAGPPRRTLEIPDGFDAAAFSPDGTVLATAGSGAVKLWRLTGPGTPASVEVGQPWIDLTNPLAVSFSPDGRELAIGGVDSARPKGALCLASVAQPDWNATQPMSRRCTHASFDTGTLTYTASGAIVSGDSDGGVRLWRQPLRRFGPMDTYQSAGWALSRDDRLLVASMASPRSSTDIGKVLGVWALDRPDAQGPVATLDLTDTPQYVAFVTATVLLTVAHDGTVTLWDLRDREHPAATSPGRAQFPTYHTDIGDSIISAGVSIVDTDPRRPLLGVQYGGRLHVLSVSDAATTRELGSLPLADPAHDTTAVVDARTAVVIESSALVWWDITDPSQPVRTGASALGDGKPRGFTVSNSGVVTATMGELDGGRLTVHSADGGRVRSSAQLPGRVGGTIQSGDAGHLLAATGPDDGGITLWDLTDRARPRPRGAALTKPGVDKAIFNRAETMLADWRQDFRTQEIQLWDVTGSGPPAPVGTLAPLSEGEGGSPAAAFAHSGDRLLVLIAGSARFYETDPARLADRLCGYTGSSITEEQWQQYAPGIPYHRPCP
ncbi:trypsin-like peptidase domain-containing protein [Kitasatospora sp. NPDC051170]|uniref:nSTAND1 domain-containing NTPase n=1 Tax=Kitasatospora sp. NPDC051170 TaxID=3364056 RepID=UPI0037B9FDDB